MDGQNQMEPVTLKTTVMSSAVSETVMTSTVLVDNSVSCDNLVIDAGDDGSSGKSVGTPEHRCEMCHRTFTNKKEFLVHQYHHKEKSSFYCAFCFKNFSSEFAFKKHNKIHEKKKAKMVLCTICAANFEYVKDLEEHHRKFHLNQKMYRCERCEATFSWRENLNKHMRMHATPTVTHKCEHCLKKFMDNTSLRLHSCPKKPESQKEDKPFVCKLCDKKFMFDFSFRAHMNSHEGPVAISAWKNVQKAKMELKSKEVKAAAEKQLMAVRKTEKVDTTNNVARVPTSRPSVNESTENQENLKEIVLEIVNVNELPSGNAQQGAQILAQGPKADHVSDQEPLTVNTSGLVAKVDLEHSLSPVIPNQDPRMCVSEVMAVPQVAPLAAIDPSQLNQASIINTSHAVTMKQEPNPVQVPLQMSQPQIITQAQFPPNPVMQPHIQQSQILIPQPQISPPTIADPTAGPETMVVVESAEQPPTPEIEEFEESPENIEVESAMEEIPPVTTSLFSGVVGDTSGTQAPEKRSKRPLLYDYVMTEEKPFQCPQCLKEFRWEISLNIHLQEHMGGVSKTQRNRKMSRKAQQAGANAAGILSHQASQIVGRRASSDEEEDYDPEFVFSQSAVVKRKRGRPRKYPTEPEQPKRKRGRPPKIKHDDPVLNQLENTAETVVIRVTRGTAADAQYTINNEISMTNVATETSAPSTTDIEDDANGIHIPRHQLIRFYLLRQLKLSRYRGFYPCRFCSKPFSSKASLNMHILRHTGKGSYLCRHCGQKFPDHRTLVLHRLIEEEDEEAAGEHQCSTCCRECASASGLRRHRQRHLPTVWPSTRPRVKH